MHQYVGIGFTTGLGGAQNNYYLWNGELNFPIGVLANFHFYQLIADKTGKNIHSDKLDVYAGINAGSGLAIEFGGGNTVVPLAFGGFQVGGRYYFTSTLGVYAEVGYGKSIITGGLVFKL